MPGGRDFWRSLGEKANFSREIVDPLGRIGRFSTVIESGGDSSVIRDVIEPLSNRAPLSKQCESSPQCGGDMSVICDVVEEPDKGARANLDRDTLLKRMSILYDPLRCGL